MFIIIFAVDRHNLVDINCIVGYNDNTNILGMSRGYLLFMSPSIHSPSQSQSLLVVCNTGLTIDETAVNKQRKNQLMTGQTLMPMKAVIQKQKRRQQHWKGKQHMTGNQEIHHLY